MLSVNRWDPSRSLMELALDMNPVDRGLGKTAQPMSGGANRASLRLGLPPFNSA